MKVKSAGAVGAARRGLVATLAAAALTLVAACGNSGSGTGTGESAMPANSKPSSSRPSAVASSPGAVEASAAALTISPEDGATGVSTSGALKVAVAQGTLSAVKVTDDDGKEVAGTVTTDGTSWTPARHLDTGTRYSVTALAKDAKGLEAAGTATFTTLSPGSTFSASDNITDRATYGVGMIVSVTFTKPVKDTKAVERAITFDTDPPVEVKGHWFGNRRLDFRPQDYWKPGTRVTVKYRLDGVQSSPGVYGTLTKDEPFEIGRSQISTADATGLQMAVERDGQTVRSLPITTGAPEYASWAGTMVISEMARVTRMNSATVGLGAEYDIADVPHAIRLTSSGTFLHGNYWADSFGRTNTSHGCIGIRDVKGGSENSDAGWFYNQSLIGDIVKVVNSKGGQVRPDNGLSGWNLPWTAW
ncbi:Ig-like domain-containing protein [Kitasatospora sp. NPDC058406]|uniref:L,D-transpeptidase n=1 Tax=Kitasatospora sp. NPDC058406 TaxID=3346483 RepID=UPI00365FE181